MTVSGICPKCETPYERANTDEYTCNCGWQELQPVADSGDQEIVAAVQPKSKRKAGAQQES